MQDRRERPAGEIITNKHCQKKSKRFLESCLKYFYNEMDMNEKLPDEKNRVWFWGEKKRSNKNI